MHDKMIIRTKIEILLEREHHINLFEAKDIYYAVKNLVLGFCGSVEITKKIGKSEVKVLIRKIK